MEAATPQDHQSSKDTQREWPQTKDIKSSETRELVSNGDVPKGAADEAANSEREQLAAERLQMVLERLYGQHYRAAQKFLRNRTLRKMNAKPGLTLYERIMAYRKLKESDEVQQTGGTSTELAGEQAASSTGSNSTSTAFQRSDTSFDSVDISDLTTFEEEKVRTPTPEPTFDRRSNSAKVCCAKPVTSHCNRSYRGTPLSPTPEIRTAWTEPRASPKDARVVSDTCGAPQVVDDRAVPDPEGVPLSPVIKQLKPAYLEVPCIVPANGIYSSYTYLLRSKSVPEINFTADTSDNPNFRTSPRSSRRETGNIRVRKKTAQKCRSLPVGQDLSLAQKVLLARRVEWYIASHGVEQQREVRATYDEKLTARDVHVHLDEQISQDHTTNQTTRRVETTHRSNSIAGRTEHEAAAIATTVTAVRAHSSSEQRETRVVEKKKEKQLNQQVSIDNTTNRTRHVETTHRSNSTVGSTGHEVAAIATTVTAERAHSPIKQKEAQADVVEKKKEKPFNKQVSQDNTTSQTTRSVETTHRSNSTAGRTEHEVAAITTTVNAEHAHSSNEERETRVVEKKKEKQLNQQGDKKDLQTVKDQNINSSEQNINLIREQDITKQSHKDVINTTAETKNIESLSDSRKQTTEVKDVVKEKHTAASQSVTETHSRDKNKVEEVAKTAKIQKSTSKTMESANKATVANEIPKSIVEPRTSPDRMQSSEAPGAKLVVPKVVPNPSVATPPTKPKPPPAGKAKPDPERKAADKKMAETIEALDKMADRSIQSLMGGNATAADELPVDQETLNKVFSREFQAELDNFLRTT